MDNSANPVKPLSLRVWESEGEIKSQQIRVDAKTRLNGAR